MTKQTILPTKEKFLKIYANLPSLAREEIIYVTEDKDKRPYTWNAVYVEINNNTSLSKSILSYLEKLSII
ncbi:MAG: hypothetical protein HYV37_03010 [Candidatus Levyibacteriota bacterium]|nr:MAG: hypothetical protein HYV37_03010 [Candidatus Levybacteria bacterium]